MFVPAKQHLKQLTFQRTSADCASVSGISRSSELEKEIMQAGKVWFWSERLVSMFRRADVPVSFRSTAFAQSLPSCTSHQLLMTTDKSLYFFSLYLLLTLPSIGFRLRRYFIWERDRMWIVVPVPGSRLLETKKCSEKMENTSRGPVIFLLLYLKLIWFCKFWNLI